MITSPLRRRCAYSIVATNSLDMRVWRQDKELVPPWKRFCALCQQLAADGFDYQVKIETAPTCPDKIVLRVTGIAGRAKPSRTKTKQYGFPAVKTAAECRKNIVEVESFLPGGTAVNGDWRYWRRRKDRCKELTGMSHDVLQAELEYWRELELLAETRDRWKPGLESGVDKADMEVKAA